MEPSLQLTTTRNIHQMATPIDHQWQADGRCQRRRVMHVVFVGAVGTAMLALFDAGPLDTGETTVASGSMRLLDQATDAPAPGLPLPPGVGLPPGSVVLPGGPDLPPLPSAVDLSQLSRPDVQQVWARMLGLMASPPPDVPNEVCRFNFNTVRVPC